MSEEQHISEALESFTVLRAPSPEVMEANRLRQERDAHQMHRIRVDTILKSARLPKRQSKNETIDRTGKWGETEAKVSDRLGTGFLIALIGIRGCGKTQLAVELARKNAEKMKNSRYCTAVEFFMDVKASYRKDAEKSEAEVVEGFGVSPLLIIDELGQRSENDWENRLLYELLNRRYNAMKDTLIISNQDLAQLETALGPSLVSRMQETGGVFECNWESYRK